MQMTSLETSAHGSAVPYPDAPRLGEADAHRAEMEVKSAARKVIARLSRAAMLEDLPLDDIPHYQSMLAQLALAQLALTYPRAALGTCATEGAQLAFFAEEDGLYVRCTGPEGHGWKIG